MNFRGLKKFCLVLENCEEIVLTPDEVVRFRLCGIKNEVIYASGGIIEYQSCEELFLELSPQADRHYDWYGETSEDRAFQRLARPDLTNVELTYEDGTTLYVAVPWENDENEWTNRLQTAVRTKAGTMQILISRSGSVSEILPEEPS